MEKKAFESIMAGLEEVLEYSKGGAVVPKERDQARVDLFRLLQETEADVRAGDRGVLVKTARRRLLK